MPPLTLLDTRYQANNTAAPSRLAQQVRYVGRAGLFDRLLQAQDIGAARLRLAAHGVAPAWGGPVAFHRLILSLRGGELEDPTLLRVLTSVALDDLGQLLDRHPVWVAGIHRDTGNLHAHILLAGSDQRGRPVALKGDTLDRFKARIEARGRVLGGAT